MSENLSRSVQYVSQTRTDAEKTIARRNIDAISEEEANLSSCNAVYVNTSISENIDGYVYKTFCDAFVYVQAQNPSSTNVWVILLSEDVLEATNVSRTITYNGETISLDENDVLVVPYIFVFGEGTTEIKTWVVSRLFSSNRSFSDIPLTSAIKNCVIHKIDLSSSSSETNLNVLVAYSCQFNELTNYADGVGSYKKSTTYQCGLIAIDTCVFINCDMTNGTTSGVYNAMNAYLVANGANFVACTLPSYYTYNSKSYHLLRAFSSLFIGCTMNGGEFGYVSFKDDSQTALISTKFNLNGNYDLTNSSISNAKIQIDGSTNSFVINMHNCVIYDSTYIFIKIDSNRLNLCNCNFNNAKLWVLSSVTSTGYLCSFVGSNGILDSYAPSYYTITDNDGVSSSSYRKLDASENTNVGDVFNPTGTTLTTNDVQSAIEELDNNKVEKEEGKVLSSNDYTTIEKTKLSGIEVGAQVNVQANWNETDTTSKQYILNKPTFGTSVSLNTTDTITNSSSTIPLTSAVYNALLNKQNTLTQGIGITISSNVISLNVADSSNIGGVKLGGNITVDSNNIISLVVGTDSFLGATKLYSVVGTNTDGTITQSALTTLLNAKQGTLTQGTGITIVSNVISLAKASTTTLGGIIVGSNLSIDENGVLSASSPLTQGTGITIASNVISLNIATTTLGGVKNGGNVVVSSTGTMDYSLPIASTTSLGGIKVGTNLTIAEDGTLNANSGSYTLPIASTTTLGGVKVDGTTVLISSDGVISATSEGGTVYQSGTGISFDTTTTPVTINLSIASTTLGGVKNGGNVVVSSTGTMDYTLSTATSSTLGGVIVGNGLSVDTSGNLTLNYSLPIATSSTLGGVKIGDGISISTDGTITLNCPIATTTTLGDVIVGSGISVDANGVISVTTYTQTYPISISSGVISLLYNSSYFSVNSSNELIGTNAFSGIKVTHSGTETTLRAWDATSTIGLLEGDGVSLVLDTTAHTLTISSTSASDSSAGISKLYTSSSTVDWTTIDDGAITPLAIKTYTDTNYSKVNYKTVSTTETTVKVDTLFIENYITETTYSLSLSDGTNTLGVLAQTTTLDNAFFTHTSSGYGWATYLPMQYVNTDTYYATKTKIVTAMPETTEANTLYYLMEV